MPASSSLAPINQLAANPLAPIQVSKIADLPFGMGSIGRRERFDSDTAEAKFTLQLLTHVRRFTQANLADCIDGRRTLRLANQQADTSIEQRVVPQLPGGTYLAATKAAVAAKASIIKDATNMQAAYESIADILTQNGEEDAAHAACGAEEKLVKSVENQIADDALMSSFKLLLDDDGQITPDIRAIKESKQQLLQAGFYSTWQPTWHAEYVLEKFPQNYSYLEVDPDDETGGHHEAGIFVITNEDVGFAKNAFIGQISQQAFALTVPKMQQLARLIGVSDTEKQLIFTAFIDDALHVSNVLVAPGLPVFIPGLE